MSWKLALFAVVVCAATAFVVSRVVGGSDPERSTTRAVTVVREPTKQQRETRTESAPAKPREVAKPREESKAREVAKPPEAEEANAAAKAKERPPKKMQPATSSAPPELPLAGMTISVDPGHNGGNFSHPEEIAEPVLAGASGGTKPCNTTGTATDDGALTEAQFNWDVAQDLVPRLRKLGAKVVLTRHSNDEVGPCVDERAEIANHAHADVALSIHADGNLAEGAHGFDVIHPSTEEMVDPAMAEPSLKLAEDVRDALAGDGVPIANYVGEDGLDSRSDLAGLNLTKVPAVLVELGNMREAEEAAKLESPAYRHQLAAALASGIVSFLSAQGQ
jgi:N-acetylmuramoyl-L-alanine amidase